MRTLQDNQTAQMNTSILQVIVNAPLSLRVKHIDLKGCRTCPPRANETERL